MSAVAVTTKNKSLIAFPSAYFGDAPVVPARVIVLPLEQCETQHGKLCFRYRL